MRIGVFILLMILVAVFSYGGMYLLIRSVKNTSKLRKGILWSIPNLVLNASLIFFSLTPFVNDDIPKINDSVEFIQTFSDAEKRIRELEFYTQKLEIYLYYSQLQFQILIALFFILNLVPITIMAIILSKPFEEDTDKIQV